MISIYSEAQWQWCADRYKYGYTVASIARFLGLHRETVRRKFQKMGVIPISQTLLEPLENRKDEFNGLK